MKPWSQPLRQPTSRHLSQPPPQTLSQPLSRTSAQASRPEVEGFAHGRAIAVACDDFGLHPDIDRAALHLARQGRVQAIGCLVRGPSWPQHAHALRHLDPASVDIGLHLDLSAGAPGLSRRLALVVLILRALAGLLDTSALRLRIRSQLDAFEQHLGRPPAYVDGHQHVHQLPQVRDALLAELVGRGPGGCAQRPWLRSTRRPERRGLTGGERAAALKARLIEQLGAAGLSALAAQHGFLQNRHLLGVYVFGTDRLRHAQRLQHWLLQAQDGDLLMCHPAKPPQKGAPTQPDSTASAPQGPARYMEAQWLESPAFDQACRHAGVVLRPLSRVLPGLSLLSPQAENRPGAPELAAQQGIDPPRG